jgi:biotin carboxyl carrier protein
MGVVTNKMKYRLIINDQTRSLDVSPGEGDSLEIAWTGEDPKEVLFHSIGEGRLFLVVDGKAVEAFVADGSDGKHIFVNGKTFLVRDADKQPRRKRSGSKVEIPEQVTPPMPSVVVRILVEVGDRVKRGKGLVVVSAMKMETTLVAPYDGTVTRINTDLDAKVAPGDILVDLEKEGPADE